jgi:hypothetical protein
MAILPLAESEPSQDAGAEGIALSRIATYPEIDCVAHRYTLFSAEPGNGRHAHRERFWSAVVTIGAQRG